MEQQLIPLTEAHHQLLEARGIDPEMAARLGWHSSEANSEWLVIPFIRDGIIVNRKYRTLGSEKKFRQDKGGEQCFYNIDVFNQLPRRTLENTSFPEVIITEGEMDCAIALQCGYLAVSVPAGANEKPIEGDDSKKLQFLDKFPDDCVAVLATDDDAPGHVLRKEIALRLGWHRCKWVKYPKQCKDLNDVFLKYGKKGVDKILQEKSQYMNEGGLCRISDLADEPEMPANSPMIDGMNDLLTMRQGDLIVVTGIPNMGKSTFVNALAANMANSYAWNICVASFETHPRRGILRFLRTFFLEKPYKSKEGFALWSPEEVAYADEWINRRFCFIVPDVKSKELTTLKWLLERVKAAVTQYHINMVIIDPWNEIDHDRPPGMSLTEYTGYALKEFKRIAQRYMINVLIVAHPAKLEKNKDGEYDVPTMYNISDSSHWKNKSDIGIIVHMLKGEDNTRATLIKMEKIREWGVMGNIGEVKLKFLPSTSRYEEYPEFLEKIPEKRTREKKPKVPDKVDMPPEEPQGVLPYKDD